MIHRAKVVLSLCFALLAPQLVAAQAVPASDPAPESAPASEPVPAAPSVEQVPPAPPPPEPAAPPPAEEVPPVPESVQTPDTTAGTTSSVSAAVTPPVDDTSIVDKAKKDRCAVLMAQGQSALAQAEGCGGDDQPIFTGSIVSLTQTVAPASSTLPDSDNRFAALNLYLAPRLTLTDTWALIADVTMAHEQTQPDDTADRQKLQWTDPRLIAVGSLGKFAGFNFTASPRLTIPVSRPSRASDAYLGTGVGLNIIRSMDVLDGLALVLGGTYNHTFAGNVVRTNDDRDDRCNDVSGATVSCPVGNAGIVQDSLRAVGTASLSFNAQFSAQLQYLYGWNLVKKLPDISVDDLPPNDGTTDFVGQQNGSRWRRSSSLTLSLNYQPVDWVIATVQGNTSVCYSTADGSQSALGGCSGGSAQSDFWLRNPIVNKFSTLALSFTIPLDVVYMRIKNRQGEEQRTAKARAAGKL